MHPRICLRLLLASFHAFFFSFSFSSSSSLFSFPTAPLVSHALLSLVHGDPFSLVVAATSVAPPPRALPTFASSAPRHGHLRLRHGVAAAAAPSGGGGAFAGHVGGVVAPAEDRVRWSCKCNDDLENKVTCPFLLFTSPGGCLKGGNVSPWAKCVCKWELIGSN